MSSPRSPACGEAGHRLGHDPGHRAPARPHREYYNINQQNVHAYVFGEHGDTSFVPWSMATVSNIAIDKYAQSLTNTDFVEPKLVHSEVETYIRKSGGKIIERKGRDLLRGRGLGLPHLQVRLLRRGIRP